MEYIEVIYGRSNWKPISLLIQIRTLSHWSHIGGIVNGKVIEAVGGQGVVITSLEDFKARYSSWQIGKLPVISRDYAEKYLLDRVGAPYDTKAVLSFLLALGYDDTEAFHCSELLAGATQFFNKGRLNEIPPSILRKLTYDTTRIFTHSTKPDRPGSTKQR